jgi:D-arabinose 1-dehydrogenase-like Zn-dependent alcohol dehydrogenase
MSPTGYKFEGWLGYDSSAAEGNMKWAEFEPKPWEETDVDIKITHCGICGSDLHTLRSGWVSETTLHEVETRAGG